MNIKQILTEVPFAVSDEEFADIQMLRYKVEGFGKLSLQQKCYVYCLAKATLFGRDITFDQFGRYNLRIRRLVEWIYAGGEPTDNTEEWQKLVVYMKRVWFSNGIYHHYGSEKIIPDCGRQFVSERIATLVESGKPLPEGESFASIEGELLPVMFDPTLLPKKVNKAHGEDIVMTSACNFYDGVTQQEAEEFYNSLRTDEAEPPSWGLNTTLVKAADGKLTEQVWHLGGRYGKALKPIVYWLEKASQYAKNDRQKRIISLLVDYYTTGNLRTFDRYCIEWVKELDGDIDFVNGFIEVYNDPLGLKAAWEGIVELKDQVATQRTATISSNAQWFEQNSPVDPRFKKAEVKGISATVVEAVMLGGEEYPSSAIGINLPNADWIRARHGSKSVTISNLTKAYADAAKGNGFREEFVIDQPTIDLINRWGHLCDDLHTDLHECLGHGSGQLLSGVSPDALKAYGNTIEEARADLFGLYYIADPKMVELGLLPDMEAHKSQYYTYMMNGLLTQMVRIKPGHVIEEAHMRNRALIARWVLAHGGDAVQLVERDGKTFVAISDYARLRQLFAELLAEVQRIKSEGDFDAARELVEGYGVAIDAKLHEEVLSRYKKLNLAPYKGFINPRFSLVKDERGEVVDVAVSYDESYTEQMLRYSKEYSTL
ncbi:MAG: dihydrofolate reductase [Prevotella sp.]|nr:dihydrofolate reductase [Prevotella sp.]